MIFENTIVDNFQGAFRGLRNPLESWAKSDSYFGIGDIYDELDFEVADSYCLYNKIDVTSDHYDSKKARYSQWLRDNGILYWNDNTTYFKYAYIGPKDLDLAHRMINAGESDSKFLRQISVSVDITAPIYWWKEFDTYKIGTTANSTSTMHKLASTPITLKNIETDDYVNSLILYTEDTEDGDLSYFTDDLAKELLRNLETLRIKYLETKDKKYWKELVRWLPCGWLQKRTVTMNYAVLRKQYFQRQRHKLSEWRQYCNWIETLPYADDLIIYNNDLKK